MQIEPDELKIKNSALAVRFMKIRIDTELAPKPVGPYSQAVQVGNIVFLSGQIGINPETGILEESLSEQAERVIKNLEAVLNKAKCKLEDVVKTTVFLCDMDDYPEVNKIYEKYFSSSMPARSCVEAVLPKDALVEIDAVAVVPAAKKSD